MTARAWMKTTSFAGRLETPKPAVATANVQPVEQWHEGKWVVRMVEIQPAAEMTMAIPVVEVEPMVPLVEDERWWRR